MGSTTACENSVATIVYNAVVPVEPWQKVNGVQFVRVGVLDEKGITWIRGDKISKMYALFICTKSYY